MITRLQASEAIRNVITNEQIYKNMCLHLAFPSRLEAAALHCFLEKIENEHSEIIRQAIKQLDDGGYLR